MDTKLKGDISEQSVILQGLNIGFASLRPIGDRLPYDLVFDIKGHLCKIQVKSAWFNKKRNNWEIDVRQSITNSRTIKRKFYKEGDFDFLIAHIQELNIFYIFPFEFISKSKGAISLVEVEKRQRCATSKKYKNNWEVLHQWALKKEDIYNTHIVLDNTIVEEIEV